MKKTVLTSFLLSAFACMAIGQDIAFNEKELYPEGVAYNKKQKMFYVSSVHQGKIGKMDLQGNYSTFVDDAELISSIGIISDEKRKLLYVCVSDPGASVKSKSETQGKFAKLIAYDTNTGQKRFSADLGALNTYGGNFVNDVTLDDKGNIYVTNSFSPIIYKITQSGEASIFATHEDWKGEGFNLNGIVFHPSGYLIVAQSNSGNLYKVSTDNPKKIHTIKIAPLIGADGLILNNQKELVVMSNAKNEIYQLTTDNNWESAALKKTIHSKMTFPTTGVQVQGKNYILNAKLDELFNPKAEKTSDFLLQEVKF
jgi:DNA-binding beta-propeller fold protein YncE